MQTSNTTESVCTLANHRQCQLGVRTMCVFIIVVIRDGEMSIKIGLARRAAHGRQGASRAMAKTKPGYVSLTAPIRPSGQYCC